MLNAGGRVSETKPGREAAGVIRGRVHLAGRAANLFGAAPKKENQR